MNKLTRSEKEKLIIEKVNHLYLLKNGEGVFSSDHRFSDKTDKQIDKVLEKISKELFQYERIYNFKEQSKYIIYFVVKILAVFGLIGLLVFGIKQII